MDTLTKTWSGLCHSQTMIGYSQNLMAVFGPCHTQEVIGQSALRAPSCAGCDCATLPSKFHQGLCQAEAGIGSTGFSTSSVHCDSWIAASLGAQERPR